MSQAFIKKLMDAQFKNISDKGWFATFAEWCINSKFRTYKAMDRFLKEQIDNPAPELVALAKSLKVGDQYKTVAYIERWVYSHFEYVPDDGEEWLTAIESFKKRKDDCEGQNGLIYVLCRLAGIDAELLYCCVGDTSAGYHFWTLFFDVRRDRFVRLDSTVYPEIKDSTKDKAKFKLGSVCKSIDFIFNENGIWRFK